MGGPVALLYRSRDELVRLKQGFYSAKEEDKRRAIDRVHALMSRGRIPHAVEATLWLVELQLQDVDGANHVALNMAYAMLIVRFVNGLLDPFQQGAVAVPLYVLARNIDLPALFVELRHQATHESIPSIELCRQACAMALSWLAEHYWSEVEENGEVESENDHMLLIVNLVKNYRALFKADEANFRAKHLGKVAELFRLVDQGLLIEGLIERNLLVNKKQKPLIKCFTPLFHDLGFQFQLDLYHALVVTDLTEASIEWLLTLFSLVLNTPKRFLNTTKLKIFTGMWAAIEAAHARADPADVPVQEKFLALFRNVLALINQHMAKEVSDNFTANLTATITKLDKKIEVRKEFGVQPSRLVTPTVKRPRLESKVVLFEKVDNWRPTPFGVSV